MTTKQDVMKLVDNYGVLTSTERVKLSALLDQYREGIVDSVPCKKSGITLQSMDNTWRADGWNKHCEVVEAWKQKQIKGEK